MSRLGAVGTVLHIIGCERVVTSESFTFLGDCDCHIATNYIEEEEQSGALRRQEKEQTGRQ